MALCHECGEQVAENDIFCPHCGISLEPISLGGGDPAAEFEKTVVMSPPNKSNKGLKIQVGPDEKPPDVEPVSAAHGDKTQKDEITPPEPELLRNAKSKDIDMPANVFAQVEKIPTESKKHDVPMSVPEKGEATEETVSVEPRSNLGPETGERPPESIGSEAPFGAVQSANPEAPTEPESIK